jgi:hypothetical protein
VLISSRKKGEQAPHLDLAVKGCAAEVRFWTAMKAGWAWGEDPQDCHGFPWSALSVGLQLERAPAAFFSG